MSCLVGSDGKSRCPWPGEDPEYLRYHDEEWGVPLRDDKKLFELLLLEGAQAGLSWITILRKRENYRRAFDGFDPEKMAAYDETRFARLLVDGGIVRNRLKVRAFSTNAKAYLKLTEQEGRFSDWLWRFVDGTPIVGDWERMDEVPAETEISKAMSRELKSRGFTFVGSTICYAFMQSAGLADDHLSGCWRHRTSIERAIPL